MKNRSRKSKSRTSRSHYDFQSLEPKRCLASVGWDGPGQGSAELSYYIGDAPQSVGQETFESVIQDALEVWADVADIQFTETQTPNQADSLDITFSQIDGRGGILAQAYFPDDLNRNPIAGDIQFDASESWEVGNQLGSQAFDLLYVAVHEIGHALGLEHIHDTDSVLSDTVSANQQFEQLSEVDRNAILSLYAPAETANEPVDNPPQEPLDPPVDPPTTQDPTHDHPEDEQHENDLPDRSFRWWNTRRLEFFTRRLRFILNRFQNSLDVDFQSSPSEQPGSDPDSSVDNTPFRFRIFRISRFR